MLGQKTIDDMLVDFPAGSLELLMSWKSLDRAKSESTKTYNRPDLRQEATDVYRARINSSTSSP